MSQESVTGILNYVMQVAGAGSSRKGKSKGVKYTELCGVGRKASSHTSYNHLLRPLCHGTGLGLADWAFMCVRSRSSRLPWRCS